MARRKPVRVLYCENNVDGTIGGSYFSLLYLAKGLDRSRFEPIVVFYTEHTLLSAFKDAKIETIVWPQTRFFSFASRMRGPLKTPMLVVQKALNSVRGFVLPALSRAWFLVRRNIKIVHLNNSVLGNHDWMLAARLTGRKCLTHERGINERYTGLAKYFGSRLDAVICISDAVKRNMQERGAGFANLKTIYNGLDPAMMKVRTPAGELRARHGIEPEHVVVGMIGNIRAWKGQETVVRAIDIVRRTCPNVRCVFVGDTSPQDREYERKLHEELAARGIKEHVIFAGYQRNVADYLMMFDVVIHASVLPEPFGRVLLEAMACRKPVIGARAGAVPEILEDGESGLTFPPGDAEHLAVAITKLIVDRDEARRLGDNGHDRLMREFHINRNVESTERIYETLVGAAH